MSRVDAAAAKAELAQAELVTARLEEAALDHVAKAASSVYDAKLDLEAAQAALAVALREASAAGVSLRPIARAAGLSVEWTRNLIAKA